MNPCELTRTRCDLIMTVGVTLDQSAVNREQLCPAPSAEGAKGRGHLLRARIPNAGARF